jgi:hypothetical protein
MAIGITELIDKAQREISAITGLEISTTLGIGKDDSNWKITLEMVEKHSIPDQMDILGIYEVFFDENGDLIRFRRKGLRKRIETSGFEEV